MKRETIDQYIERMQREIRRFYKSFPWEFRECIAEFEAWAKPEPRGRGQPKTPRHVRMAILAEWLNAKAESVPKTRFLRMAAEKGWPWSDKVHKPRAWYSEDTIDGHIKAAQRLARTDPKFAAEVAGYRVELRELRGK